MTRLLIAFLAGTALALSSPAFAQKPAKKKPAAKKAASSQDWGRFNTGAKKDLDAIDKKAAKK